MKRRKTLDILQIKEATTNYVLRSEAVAELMVEESKADRELFWVLHLNTKKALIEKELVAMGTLDSACIHPREVFRKAVINSSSSIITVHNHPAGSAEPSSEDRKVWSRLEQAGEILGIKVIDHIIITPSGKFFSLAKGWVISTF